MPEYLRPGVYVEEIERGPRPIEGVATSTVAMLGETERGPLTPTLVTSAAEFTRVFGGHYGDQRDYLPDAVRGFFENGGQRCLVCRIVGAEASSAWRDFGGWRARALGAGRWGRRIFVRIDAGTPTGVGSSYQLRVAYWREPPAGGLLSMFDPWSPANAAMMPPPDATEVFDSLSADRSHERFGPQVIGKESLYIRVEGAAHGADPEAPPTPGSGALDQEGGDSPVAPGVADYLGEPAGRRVDAQGLAALEALSEQEVALVHAPYPRRERVEISRALIGYCKRTRRSFAVIDSGRNNADLTALDPRMHFDSSYAAYYVPWLLVLDGATQPPRPVPPGGFVLGISRAPTSNVVCTRRRPTRSCAASSGSNARSAMPSRRFSIHAASMSSGSCRVAASACGAHARCRPTASGGTSTCDGSSRSSSVRSRKARDGWSSSLTPSPPGKPCGAKSRTFYADSGLAARSSGRTENEAFFVKCDRTTMTQDDIDQGRLIIEIGVAPVRGAEFVIVHIGQRTIEAG